MQPLPLSRLSKMVIGGVASLHALSVLGFYFYLISAAIYSSDRIWYWMIWGLIDFPISLVVILGILPAYDIVLLIYHLTIGTVWWGIVAYWVMAMAKSLSKKHNASASD